MKQFVLLLSLISIVSAQSVLPVTTDIMRSLQDSYRSGEVDSYIAIVLGNQKLSEQDSIDADSEIRGFFESDQFVTTGAQYLTSLFSERELNEMLAVLSDSSLRNDPNFGGSAKLDSMMNRLKPYIVKYLRMKTR